MVQGQLQYLAETARALGLLDNSFNNVNRLAVRSWPFIITDPSRSHHGSTNASLPAGQQPAAQPNQARPPQAAPQQAPQQFQPAPQQVPQQFQPVPQAQPPASAIPRARALYPFQGQDHTELTFQPGEMINIYRQAGDWWEGELNGRRGLFPAAYVQLV